MHVNWDIVHNLIYFVRNGKYIWQILLIDNHTKDYYIYENIKNKNQPHSQIIYCKNMNNLHDSRIAREAKSK